MEKIHLSSNEELFSILSKIQKSADNELILVIPDGFSTLRSIINLKALREEAVSLGKNIYIFTFDILIKKLAEQSGLKVLDKQSFIALEKNLSEKYKADKGEKVISDIVSPNNIDQEPEKNDQKIQEEKFKEKSSEEILESQIVEEPQISEEEKKIKEEIKILEELDTNKERQFGEFFEKKRDEENIEEEIFVSKKSASSFKFFTKKRLIAFLSLFVLIGGFFVLYFVLPIAKVMVNPKKETIRFETEIIADKDISTINISENKIPGQVFQLELENSKTFQTTGEKDVEEKAEGVIIIYNGYSSEDQTLVKTTRFLSDSGKIFRLKETVIIPGATINEGKIIPSSKEVVVEADEAGEAYNIGPSDFKIPGFQGTAKYTGFYGKSLESMEGGAKGRMKVATKEDIEGALEIVSAELKNKVEEQFKDKIPSDLKLLSSAETLEIIESKTSIEADEPCKEFTALVKVRAWGIAFKESDILRLVEENINNKISENKILLPSSINLSYDNINIDSEKNMLNFSCNVEADTAWKIDENRIRDELVNKNEVEVRKYLSSLAEIESARVMFWPFWANKIPSNKDKIKVIIELK